MCIGVSGMMGVEGLESSKVVLGLSSLKMAATLVTSHLDDLQLAVECVYLGRNIEYACIQLVVAGELGDQPPVIHAIGQIHGLMVGRRLP